MEQRTTSANPWMTTTVDQTAARAEDDVGEDGRRSSPARHDEASEMTTATRSPLPFDLRLGLEKPSAAAQVIQALASPANKVDGALSTDPGVEGTTAMNLKSPLVATRGIWQGGVRRGLGLRDGEIATAGTSSSRRQPRLFFGEGTAESRQRRVR